MRPDRSHTVAFSGHRSFKSGRGSLFSPAGGDDPETISERLGSTIRKLVEEGFTHFLCGMAEGFDLLAGEAVVSLRKEYPHLRLVAVIPFPGQASGFDADTRERYDQLLAAADESLIICPSYTSDCFLRRNDWLVDNASVLLCRFNGSKGGTAYTVRRAISTGLKIINLELS